jgi:mono/diheme cytochrome c family protein
MNRTVLLLCLAFFVSVARAAEPRVALLQGGQPVQAAARSDRTATFHVSTPFVIRVAFAAGRAAPNAIQLCASRDRRIFDQVKPGIATSKVPCYGEGTGMATSSIGDDPRGLRLFLSKGDGHNYYNSIRRVDASAYSDLFVNGIAEVSGAPIAVGTVYVIVFVDDNGDRNMDASEFEFLELAVIQPASSSPAASAPAARPLPRAYGPLAQRGQRLYNFNCVACHQSYGQGAPPAFPPLAGAAILEDKQALIRATLFPAPRTAMASHCHLPIDEIAAILTYIRSAWPGPQREAISPEDVLQVIGTVPGRVCGKVARDDRQPQDERQLLSRSAGSWR